MCPCPQLDCPLRCLEAAISLGVPEGHVFDQNLPVDWVDWLVVRAFGFEKSSTLVEKTSPGLVALVTLL